MQSIFYITFLLIIVKSSVEADTKRFSRGTHFVNINTPFLEVTVKCILNGLAAYVLAQARVFLCQLVVCGMVWLKCVVHCIN